jgi:hypothetical protein
MKNITPFRLVGRRRHPPPIVGMPLGRQHQGALSAFAHGKGQQREQLVWRELDATMREQQSSRLL